MRQHCYLRLEPKTVLEPLGGREPSARAEDATIRRRRPLRICSHTTPLNVNVADTHTHTTTHSLAADRRTRVRRLSIRVALSQTRIKLVWRRDAHTLVRHLYVRYRTLNHCSQKSSWECVSNWTRRAEQRRDKEQGTHSHCLLTWCADPHLGGAPTRRWADFDTTTKSRSAHIDCRAFHLLPSTKCLRLGLSSRSRAASPCRLVMCRFRRR